MPTHKTTSVQSHSFPYLSSPRLSRKLTSVYQLTSSYQPFVPFFSCTERRVCASSNVTASVCLIRLRVSSALICLFFIICSTIDRHIFTYSFCTCSLNLYFHFSSCQRQPLIFVKLKIKKKPATTSPLRFFDTDKISMSSVNTLAHFNLITKSVL